MPTEPCPHITISKMPAGVTLVEFAGPVGLTTLQELGQTLDLIERAAASEPTTTGGLILHLATLPQTQDRSNRHEHWQLSHSSDTELARHCEAAHAVLTRLSKLPCATVAIIEESCTNENFELALWCDFRITAEQGTELGFPNIDLGLVPRWGGSVRLPRITGLTIAASMLTTGQAMGARQAQAVGLVNQIVAGEEPTSLLHAATELIKQQANSGDYVDLRKARTGEVPRAAEDLQQLTAIAQGIAASQTIYPFAPTVLLEHLARTVLFPQHAAIESETKAVQQTWGSPASLGLMNHQQLVNDNRQQPGLVDLNLTPRELPSVGVIGAGLMGSSIAANCVRSDKTVRLLDANARIADTAVARIAAADEKHSLESTSDYGSIGNCDLVIESVVETLEVKKLVLGKLCDQTDKQTVIATNTSAIPIAKLAPFVSHPERFCGIHFCHPELMSLVEVIYGPETSEQTIANAVQFVRSLGKMPVAMNDGAGFVVNRLLAAMIDQSVRLLMSGVRIESIDLAMREFGFKGGPFEIIDIIGIDTCMYAGRTMWEAGLDCVSLSPVLPKLVKRGRLGRKSGSGFYRYESPRGEAISDESLPGLIEAYLSAEFPPPNQGLPQSQSESIRNQILSAITREAFQIVEEDIVNEVRDIDLCIIHGFSFPKHWGGILFWADQFGVNRIVNILDEIAIEEPRLQPPDGLRRMAEAGRSFYEQEE